MRALRQRAHKVGLDITGPYSGDVYALFEHASGDLIADQLTADEIRAEVVKHANVPRLADARRRRTGASLTRPDNGPATEFATELLGDLPQVGAVRFLSLPL
jgi:hypothetical protein